MIRLELKEQLITECCSAYYLLSRYEKCLPKRFVWKASKSIRKDFKKGLKVINKKAEVYIELPKIESVGNGMYKETMETEKVNDTKEIVVSNLNM